MPQETLKFKVFGVWTCLKKSKKPKKALRAGTTITFHQHVSHLQLLKTIINLFLVNVPITCP